MISYPDDYFLKGQNTTINEFHTLVEHDSRPLPFVVKFILQAPRDVACRWIGARASTERSSRLRRAIVFDHAEVKWPDDASGTSIQETILATSNSPRDSGWLNEDLLCDVILNHQSVDMRKKAIKVLAEYQARRRGDLSVFEKLASFTSDARISIEVRQFIRSQLLSTISELWRRVGKHGSSSVIELVSSIRIDDNCARTAEEVKQAVKQAKRVWHDYECREDEDSSRSNHSMPYGFNGEATWGD